MLDRETGFSSSRPHSASRFSVKIILPTCNQPVRTMSLLRTLPTPKIIHNGFLHTLESARLQLNKEVHVYKTEANAEMLFLFLSADKS